VVAIIGCGLVGKSWAMLFASGGHEVRLHDSFTNMIPAAVADVRQRLEALEESGNLKNAGKFSGKEQSALVSGYDDLAEALKGVTYIQECIPEDLALKRDIFTRLNHILAALGNADAIIGSSASTMPSSAFVKDLQIKSRSLVVHPVNPPYFVRLVELVPNPWTDSEVTKKVRKLMTSLGQKPIVMMKEVSGFALNRVQYAILNVTWNLVKDGILSVEDADLVTKEGLAPRYVFMGPLETAQLNADGFLDYCKKYGATIHGVSVDSQSTIPLFTVEAAAEVDQGLQELVPDSEVPERRRWRDENLAHLAQFKGKLGL